MVENLAGGERVEIAWHRREARRQTEKANINLSYRKKSVYSTQTGLIAGVINTVAAGRSLLTLPVMIFLGLPAAVANGNNGVGIKVKSNSAFSVFTRRGSLGFKLGVWCSIPAFFGCILGVRAAIDFADDWFRKILAVTLVRMALKFDGVFPAFS